MLRGRHRGLPVAIDRAVMLPIEFASKSDVDDGGGQADLETNGPQLASGHEMSSEETEWRLRRNARRRSTEEDFIAERRRGAAKSDHEAPLVPEQSLPQSSYTLNTHTAQ
ncbi:hypothetical protein B0H10DRAFT_501280 [Mycena sp. CBHHK59/15]|nr:hypothetical protein B0H10DRAFT_501280 [Mycena sp. CBHHK59/15]